MKMITEIGGLQPKIDSKLQWNVWCSSHSPSIDFAMLEDGKISMYFMEKRY
jgi:hypothetical protein